MATITPVPDGVAVPTADEAARFAASMKVAMASRKGRCQPMTARAAEIHQQLGLAPSERTFLPVGWPRDARSVAVLAHLRRTDPRWTWDKATKLLWVDGETMMVGEYADRHGITVGTVAKGAPTSRKPRATATPAAPVVAAEPVPVPLEDIAHPSPAAARAGSTLLADYLARLLHAPKREYAELLAAHLQGNGPAPEVPAAEWAAKVAAKVRRYVAAA